MSENMRWREGGRERESKNSLEILQAKKKTRKKCCIMRKKEWVSELRVRSKRLRKKEEEVETLNEKQQQRASGQLSESMKCIFDVFSLTLSLSLTRKLFCSLLYSVYFDTRSLPPSLPPPLVYKMLFSFSRVRQKQQAQRKREGHRARTAKQQFIPLKS